MNKPPKGEKSSEDKPLDVRTYLGTRIEELVKGKGEVALSYGGFEITVSDPQGFPWWEIFKTLLDASFDVWVIGKEGKTTICCKPMTD